MKSFLLPVGRLASDALSSVLSAMSCGATVPVEGLDILTIADSPADTVLPALIDDLNRMHDFFASSDNPSLFPSSFRYASFRPELPSLQQLSGSPASEALLDALRGKGVPLSYKTDAEAVDWGFSWLLSEDRNHFSASLKEWVSRMETSLSAGESFRLGLLCDLSDPFSAGITFALLRYLNQSLRIPSSYVGLFCLGTTSGTEDEPSVYRSSLRSLAAPHMSGTPDLKEPACADAVWLFSSPASFFRTPGSLRSINAVLARYLARFFVSKKSIAPGLHTVSLPGILTLQSLGDQTDSFASFFHVSAWFLSDLHPALAAYLSKPSPFLSLAPNTRNGLFRRLFTESKKTASVTETLSVLERALKAVLSEILLLVYNLPDPMRLASVSDPLWQKICDACGRTVTVGSEYDVSLAEATEAGILNIKPVHRVSMADTEEEQLEKRLSDILAQLEEETAARDTLFSNVGGGWTLPALQECQSRCAAALERAKDQQSMLNPDTDPPITIAALARRIRLLEAAVDRCERDLADPDLLKRTTPDSAPGIEGLSPFSSQLLDASFAEKLSTLLDIGGISADQSLRELSALMPSLFFGCTLPDSKALLRQLLTLCKPQPGKDPLAVLLLSMLEVSTEIIRPVRFLSDGSIPEVPLLPDFCPHRDYLTVASLLSALPDPSSRSLAADREKRGLLAMLLLRQYRRKTSEEASLTLSSFTSDSSPLLQAWLSACESDRVWIVSLDKEGSSLPFALILPNLDLIPAHFTSAHSGFLPSFASPWFNTDTLSFSDPCTLLGEADRTVLLEQLDRFSDLCSQRTSGALLSFINRFRDDLLAAKEQLVLPDHLALRLKSSFGLRVLPAFTSTLVRKTCVYERFLSTDSIMAPLLDVPECPPSACTVDDEILYLYRDIPFARENAHTLLESIPLPAEDWILSLLNKECDLLSRSSDDYHDALVRELSLLLERYPDALPEARQVVLDLLDEAGKPVSDSDTELSWPWDPMSPSIMTILSESLGETLAAVSVQPFSDLLAFFPARGSEIIGDSLFSSMCLLSGTVPSDEPDSDTSIASDALLPPLSGDFCAALCRLPEGKTLLRPGLLTFEKTEQESVRVILTLEGSFTIRLVRTYGEDEIIKLYAHDIPTLAVWPDLPLAPEDWHAYFVYAGFPSGMRLDIFHADGSRSSADSGEGRTVCRSGSFPLSFAFFRENRGIGALPNLLPSPVIEKTEPFTACVDFGSVGSSVIFSIGHRRVPLQGATLVRTLINNPASSRDRLRKEFLPAVPVSALLPTASRIFRNVPGADPLPFEDGIILMASDLQDALSVPPGALYTALKWEAEKSRAVTLCLHELMLMTALQARSDGASALNWRFAIPDEMAQEGRERLIRLFTDLSEQVEAESGLAPCEKQPLISFAPESSALGAYFRFCASEDTRGGFMVLDIGACTADISLFLRGREQAIRTCQIPLGIHYMLLPSLLQHPSLLTGELSFVQDPAFLGDLSLLEQAFRNAQADPASLRHARLALDSFIADRCPVLISALLFNPATGMPTRLGSVLLLHLSYLMMLSGLILLQISADPGKNDFLPEQMSLCLSGRGSLLPEGLPASYKAALWHFLTMFRNPRVASLSFLFSSEKKMEIPVGLSLLQDVSVGPPAAPAIPAAISVRPEELLPQFILRFAKEFPSSAEILFHGFFTGDFYHPFTPYGETVISSSISQSFTESRALRPFDALSAWIGTVLETVSSNTFES